jgi:hypothetical protein
MEEFFGAVAILVLCILALFGLGSIVQCVGSHYSSGERGRDCYPNKTCDAGLRCYYAGKHQVGCYKDVAPVGGTP